LHLIAFGGWALLEPAGGAIALPTPLAIIRAGERGGKETVGNRVGGEG